MRSRIVDSRVFGYSPPLASLATSSLAVAPGRAFNASLADWFELRASLIAAEAVTRAALSRRESRGAHQRADFPDSDPGQVRRQLVTMGSPGVAARWAP